MELRNIHFAQDDQDTERESPDSPSSEPAAPVALSETRMRIRKVTVSPHQEYALRPGDVRPISDALAALICCRKGRAEIGPKGITVERKDIGGRRIYHHVDSICCNDLSQRERKIYYVLNSLKPDIVHLLDDTGRYIESLPEKFQPHVLNNEEQAKEYTDQRRQVSRVARHLQDLHGKDTEEAIAALAHNADLMKGIVQVLAAPAGVPRQEAAPERGLGASVNRGIREIEGVRQISRDRNAAAERLQSHGKARDWDTYTPDAEITSAWDDLPEDAELPAAF